MKDKRKIEGFPQYVVEAMLDEQEKQGNKRDVKVFERSSTASQSEGGFNWDDTPQGIAFWCSVIANKNFDLIPQPQKYSKVMLVSNDKKNWYQRVVFMEKCDTFLAWFRAATLEEAETTLEVSCWRFAKDIEEEKIPEYTMEELFGKLGQKFIIKK
jgi:hypothetical protein